MRVTELRLLSVLFVCLNAIGVFAFYAEAQTTSPNEWTWMGGPSSGMQAQVTGTLGQSAAGNIPAARYQSVTWTDKSGNLWLFGGAINSSYAGTIDAVLDDLWQFNPTLNEWAWMGGSTTANQPGVYGAMGTVSSQNIPGSREGAAGWTDKNGNLWLFGGYGFDSAGVWGVLNDLWELNPSTGQWTWMSGSSTVGGSCFSNGDACAQPSVYGTLGSPSAGNTPGGREGATAWTDKQGNLWLFGGWSYDVSVQTQYYFNELWEYNPSINQWAWMGGSSTRAGSVCITDNNVVWALTCGEPGVYGTLGTPGTNNIPGGRQGAAGWTDSQGNLWLFSGNGFDAYGNFGDPNDVWKFTPASGQWTQRGPGLPPVRLQRPRILRSVGDNRNGQPADGPRPCTRLDRQQRQSVALWRWESEWCAERSCRHCGGSSILQ